MDWITQAALGALMGELMMGKRLGNRALAWGALFGVMPEVLEWLVSPVLDHAYELAVERGAGHSLVVMALGSWVIAEGLAKLWKREKITKPQAAAFVLAVWWAHSLVDCFAAEGVAVLWPLPVGRVAFGFLAPVDFLFSGPLVVAAAALAFLREAPAQKKARGKKAAGAAVALAGKRRKWCGWGLGLAAGYALFAMGMKWVAAGGFDGDLARRGTKVVRRMESPTPFNCLLWRAVVDRGDEYWVGYRSVFERRESPVRWTVYPKGAEALAKVADLRQTRTLTKISDGWWIARPHARGAWLGDLRLPETRVWGSKKGMVDSRLAASWVIDMAAAGDALRLIPPGNGSGGEYLQRMMKRLAGDRPAWEANPRLAAAGSLPEFLAVEE
ncbi:MAG: metal-dependent hydrolase [Verrucomicrobiota bacterium]